MNSNLKQIIALVLVLTIRTLLATDITTQAFGGINDTIISAFGDFDSDELTDVFVRSTDGRTLEILLASDQEPLLRRSPNTICKFNHLNITSIVPGDFDGDTFMDLLITSKSNTSNELLDVYINWGGSDILNCTDENEDPLLRMIGEPVALDYNSDMIIDLFGLNEHKKRTFWIFSDRNKAPEVKPMELPHDKGNFSQLKVPHSHAYLDLNNDFRADLFLVTENGNEIWHGCDKEGFKFVEHRQLPGLQNSIVGQSIFLDIELNENIAQVLPVCFDSDCNLAAICSYVNGSYTNLNINFKDPNNQNWHFIVPDSKHRSVYQNTITLRGGDFNLDGYPDMLVTLQSDSKPPKIQTFFMENVECSGNCGVSRSFAIRWNAFAPYSDGTVVGAFYDFYQVNNFSEMLFTYNSQNYILVFYI